MTSDMLAHLGNRRLWQWEYPASTERMNEDRNIITCIFLSLKGTTVAHRSTKEWEPQNLITSFSWFIIMWPSTSILATLASVVYSVSTLQRFPQQWLVLASVSLENPMSAMSWIANPLSQLWSLTRPSRNTMVHAPQPHLPRSRIPDEPRALR